jgi:hypothetical protein
MLYLSSIRWSLGQIYEEHSTCLTYLDMEDQPAEWSGNPSDDVVKETAACKF